VIIAIFTRRPVRYPMSDRDEMLGLIDERIAIGENRVKNLNQDPREVNRLALWRKIREIVEAHFGMRAGEKEGNTLVIKNCKFNPGVIKDLPEFIDEEGM